MGRFYGFEQLRNLASLVSQPTEGSVWSRVPLLKICLRDIKLAVFWFLQPYVQHQHKEKVQQKENLKFVSYFFYLFLRTQVLNQKSCIIVLNTTRRRVLYAPLYVTSTVSIMGTQYLKLQCYALSSTLGEAHHFILHTLLDFVHELYCKVNNNMRMTCTCTSWCNSNGNVHHGVMAMVTYIMVLWQW